MSVRIGRPPSCVCGECKQAAYMREWWRALTPEQKREKTAQRDPNRVREQDRRKMAKRRAQGTPEQQQKIAARTAVRHALEQGRLVKGPCETCGTELGVHAHHDDYGRPLDVRWLCRADHEELHRSVAA